MPSSRRTTDVVQSIGTHQRVAVGITALTLGAISLGLGVALLAAPGGVTDKFFASGQDQIVQAATSANAVTLTWTAPGDDGMTGQAAQYDLRYAASPITPANFATATQVSGVPPPLPAQSTETFTVTNLNPDTVYYFALKTKDAAGNVSALSNVVAKKTDALQTACVPVYQCTGWTSCANGKQTRTCVVTNGCPAGLGEQPTTQACTGTGGRAEVVNHIVVVGTGSGIAPKVRVLDGQSLKLLKEFAPFSSTNRYGVFVAAGDVTGDHRSDVIAGTGVGSQSAVRVFTSEGKLLKTFYPYGTKSRTGVTVAVADVTGDGTDDIIVAPASGAGSVRLYRYDATTKTPKLLAEAPQSRSYRGGYTVAADDLDLDGQAEIVTARRSMSSGYSVFRLVGSQLQLRSTVKAYPISFRSGLVVATGDVNGDGRPEVLTMGGAGYWADIKIFTATGTALSHFLPFARSFFGGGYMATRDVNGDGIDEILVTPASQATPFIRTFRVNPLTRAIDRLGTKNVFPATMRKGLRVGGV